MVTSPRRASLAAMMGLTLATGCVAVKSATPRRGAYLETRHVRTDVKESFGLALDEDDEIAHVAISRETCQVSSKEYAREEEQQIAHPAYGALVAASVVGLLGVTAVVLGHDSTPVLLGGIAGTALGGGGALANAVKKPQSGSRVVVTEARDKEEVQECSDSEHVLEKELAWTLTSIYADPTSGKTDAKGRFELRAAMLENVARMPIVQAAAKLRSDAVELELTVGPLEKHGVKLRVRDIPERWWAAWTPAYVASLSPERQMRWAACQDVFQTYSARLECTDRSDVMTGIVKEYGGDDARLRKTKHGDYAWIDEVTADAGETITLRVLMPAEGSDWLLMIIDLDAQAVIAEQFSGRSVRQDLRVVAPRKGTYAVLVNAEREAKLVAHVVVRREAK